MKNTFTLEQIKAAHSKVKSGADFPNYVQEIIALGVKAYDVFVADGHAVYFGEDDFRITSEAKYEVKKVATQTDLLTFKTGLKAHQQGKSDYLEFCQLSADCGVEKWTLDFDKMTCTYFDKNDNELLVEIVPS